MVDKLTVAFVIAIGAVAMYALGVVMAGKGAHIALETNSHAGGGYMIAAVAFLLIGATLNAALYVVSDNIDERIEQ